MVGGAGEAIIDVMDYSAPSIGENGNWWQYGSDTGQSVSWKPKGTLPYGADTVATMDKLVRSISNGGYGLTLNAGDKCGVQQTALTYEWNGSAWDALPHGHDAVGDMYFLEHWYGTKDGYDYADVVAMILCTDISDLDNPQWQLTIFSNQTLLQAIESLINSNGDLQASVNEMTDAYNAYAQEVADVSQFIKLKCVIGGAEVLPFTVSIPTGDTAKVIQWGDGTADTNGATGSVTHQYTAQGTYWITILDAVPSERVDYGTLQTQITNVVLPLNLGGYKTSQISSVTVPEGTTVIPSNFLSGNNTIREIYLPDSITTIGTGLPGGNMQSMLALVRVNIPRNISGAWGYQSNPLYSLFMGDVNLQEVVTPQNWDLMVNSALNFHNCPSIKRQYVVQMFNNLNDRAGIVSRTLGFSKSVIDRLSAGDIAIATSKNYIVSQIDTN
jgi:hypothetical protein